MHGPFTVRPARPSDHGEFTGFFRDLGHDDPVPEPDRWELEMMPHTLFLEASGAKVGYAYVEVFGERGYVRHVVVDRVWRGRGVGRALMRAIAARLRERGSLQWELNVKRDNAAAIGLYEAFGLREEYSTFVMRFDWADIARLPAPEITPRVFDVEASDDARIERTFDLPDGKLARLRSLAGQVLVRAADATGETCAFARFDPEFPGAFPFRVRSTPVARTLLEALRPLARSEPPWLQLVIEDDSATAQTLLSNGARLLFEILHMQGRIPNV